MEEEEKDILFAEELIEQQNHKGSLVKMIPSSARNGSMKRE